KLPCFGSQLVWAQGDTERNPGSFRKVEKKSEPSDIFQVTCGNYRTRRLAGWRPAFRLEADGKHRALREFFLRCRGHGNLCCGTGRDDAHRDGKVLALYHPEFEILAGRARAGHMRKVDGVLRGVIDGEVFD